MGERLPDEALRIAVCPDCGEWANHGPIEGRDAWWCAECEDEHPEPRWIKVVPAEHADALVEAMEQIALDLLCVHMPADHCDNGAKPEERCNACRARDALTRYRQATHASTGKKAGK